MKEEKMTVVKAGAALGAAIENEALHRRAAEANAWAADAARAKCAQLVTRAAAGDEVDAAALMQAQDDVRVATAESEIASAVHKGAERRRQEAEISAWFEEAERLKKAVEQRLDERFSAAAAVDSCLAELNRAVTRFNEAGQDFSNAKIAASHFTADRDARIAGNPVLAAMPAGTHPNAKNNYGAEIRQINAAIFDADRGLERQVPIQSLVQREAFLWGHRSSEVNSKP